MTGAAGHRAVLVVAAWASIASAGLVPARASLWTVAVAPASHAQAAAQAAPAAPAGVAAACASGRTITVTWNAVAHAASYTIWQSTTSATGGYTTAASGITTTTWTTPTLSSAHYWFEVTARVGVNWTGATSAATARTTISGSTCTQP